MNTSTQAPLSGKRAHTGPGGRDCACCNEAPRHRDRERRAAKRRERQAFKRSL